ncbi:MAG: hypothetical protein ACP5NQ_05810 [Vulcanisaeta sp.]
MAGGYPPWWVVWSTRVVAFGNSLVRLSIAVFFAFMVSSLPTLLILGFAVPFVAEYGLYAIAVAMLIGGVVSLIIFIPILRWFIKSMRESLVKYYRYHGLIGQFVEPRDVGFLCHKIYWLLLPTRSEYEVYMGREYEYRARYYGALPTLIVRVAINVVILFIVWFIISLFIAGAVHSWLVENTILYYTLLLFFLFLTAYMWAALTYHYAIQPTLIHRKRPVTAEQIRRTAMDVINGLIDGWVVG